MHPFRSLHFSLFVIFLALGLVGCRNSAQVTDGPPTGTFITIVKGDYPHNKIVSVDIETGAEEVLFAPPDLSVVQELVATGDGETVYFSYTPPPSLDSGFFDRTAIYKISRGETEPTLVIGGSLPDEFYTNPTLTPDGRYLFFHRLGQDFGSTTPRVTFGIERLDLETGENSLIIPNAIWPRISPDGKQIVFVTLDLLTQERGLGVADIDGSNMTTKLRIGQYFDIDSPLFSLDGKSVYFSIVEEGPQAGWFDRLMGVSVAEAHTEHNLPSTWWRLGIEDGIVEQISPEQKIVSHAFRHPAKNQILYTTREGVFSLSIGNGEVMPAHPGVLYGTLTWIPE